MIENFDEINFSLEMSKLLQVRQPGSAEDVPSHVLIRFPKSWENNINVVCDLQHDFSTEDTIEVFSSLDMEVPVPVFSMKAPY